MLAKADPEVIQRWGTYEPCLFSNVGITIIAVIDPRLQAQFTVSILGAAAIALALYTLNAFDMTLQSYFVPRTVTSTSYETFLKVIKLMLWSGLALVLIRAAIEFIFGFVLRIRKGYEAPNIVRNIFSIIAYITILTSIFKSVYPDIELGTLFTTSAIFGVIIGLALQDTLGNLFAGISLHADKPFQTGDVIRVGNWTGVVESVTWRAVKLRTFQNHIILLNNSNVAKEALEVCPRENLNARLVSFTTVYTDSPERTIRVVLDAIRGSNNVSQQFKPVVRIKNLGESGVEYEVKYWLEDYTRYNDTDALVRQRIWYAFRRAEIHFAYPTRTLHVARRVKQDGVRADRSEFVERLSGVSVFAPLSSEEIIRLAEASTSHLFAPGEMVIRAGDQGSSMFVMHRGAVEVRASDNGNSRTVAVLKEGDFFGEMALFKGEPRAANVVAAEETEVLEIGHEALKELFEINPGLVESLSHVIAERRTDLAAKLQGSEIAPNESAGVITSIKRFFGIK